MKPVRLADLATAAGMGNRTAARLVREGRLPGFMAGERYVCPPGEYEDWLQGRWTYRGTPSDPVRDRDNKPLQFVRTIRQEGAA